MAQVKSKKGGVSLDMTAMCDVAFLLLTFFILTAKMKTPEPAKFEIPASVSDKKLPDENILKISISNEGAVFYSVREQSVKKEVIEEIDKMYKLNLSQKQKDRFIVLENFGVPMRELGAFLSMDMEKVQDFKQKGILMDSTNNELKAWVRVTKTIQPEMRIAIKGDKDADYETFSRAIESLQELHLNKFSLITALEAKPSN
jgi:biopolymer transport protein ExbD